MSYGSIAPATEDCLRLAIVISCDPNKEHRVQEKVALGPRRGQRYTQLIGCIETVFENRIRNEKHIALREAETSNYEGPQYAGKEKMGKVAPPRRERGTSLRHGSLASCRGLQRPW
jgi:hypothetical protein